MKIGTITVFILGLNENKNDYALHLSTKKEGSHLLLKSPIILFITTD